MELNGIKILNLETFFVSLDLGGPLSICYLNRVYLRLSCGILLINNDAHMIQMNAFIYQDIWKRVAGRE